MAHLYEISVSKILLTGFEPFAGQSENPSQKIVQALEGFEGVETLILPVTFAEAFARLESKLQSGAFETVLCFGQAQGRRAISLERVALNWIETERPDENGVRPEPRRISDAGPLAFLSPLPLQAWSESLRAAGIRVEVSLSAGGYVCNFLYYSLCLYLRGHGTALFIHVPALPEQVAPGEPCMDFSDMLKAARQLVRLHQR